MALESLVRDFDSDAADIHKLKQEFQGKRIADIKSAFNLDTVEMDP